MSTVRSDSQRQAGPGDEQAPPAIAAWRALDIAHARLGSELTTALERNHHLSLNAHAVLAQLVRAPEQKLRMTEIAHLINFSLSGLTGLVGRLERDGLVERESNFADRRVIYACLTDLGRQVAAESNVRYQDTLDATLGRRLSASELTTLTDLLRRAAGQGAENDGRA